MLNARIFVARAWLAAPGLIALGCAAAANDTTSEAPASQAAAETGDPQGMSAEQMAEIEKRMAESAVPGPEHEILAQLAGDFTMETTINMGPEPMTMTAETHSEMILGGRFLLQHTQGGEGPMAMESYTIMGFDRRHGHFTVYGCDTMGTYCVSGAGPWDPATKSMTLYGEDVDPIGGITQKYDFVITVPDPDTYTFEVIFKPGVFGNAEPLVAVTNTSRRKK